MATRVYHVSARQESAANGSVRFGSPLAGLAHGPCNSLRFFSVRADPLERQDIIFSGLQDCRAAAEYLGVLYYTHNSAEKIILHNSILYSYTYYRYYMTYINCYYIVYNMELQQMQSPIITVRSTRLILKFNIYFTVDSTYIQ